MVRVRVRVSAFCFTKDRGLTCEWSRVPLIRSSCARAEASPLRLVSEAGNMTLNIAIKKCRNVEIFYY